MAGDVVGAAIAEVDMVAIWDTVKDIRVGKTGFARLVTADGTLIAHGDPEESRSVFLRKKDTYAAQIRGAAHAGVRYHDSQGREVIALAANVRGVDWTVIVEQPVAEAFLGATGMRHDLYIVFVGALVLALAAGFFVGQPIIRWIEVMRAHVSEVGKGNLDSRIRIMPRVAEMKQLATALNQMTEELYRLQNEIKSKERLSTFARVAAGLAHDLQTPIESIRGACDLVLQRPDEEAARDLLRSAAESHLPRLHRYVRDLRRLAHDGSVPLELTSVDPRSLADRVAKDAGTSPKWQGVEFGAEGHASRIWVDESLVVRAVSNLAGNAADACVMRRPPIGRVTISVSDDPDGSALNIDVSDTGVGIPADRLADLMIHDFRSTKRNSGVGLGLGVARHVATSHGGVITATSTEGEGSVFRLKIPRQAMAGVSAGDAAATGRQGGKTA
jgi:signal transduction histidine kinase